jgi:hypothetical protein
VDEVIASMVALAEVVEIGPVVDSKTVVEGIEEDEEEGEAREGGAEVIITTIPAAIPTTTDIPTKHTYKPRILPPGRSSSSPGSYQPPLLTMATKCITSSTTVTATILLPLLYTRTITTITTTS